MSSLSTSHLRRAKYGNFLLTDAVRPGPSVPIVPIEGYRLSWFRDAETGLRLPCLGAAISAEKLFDVFLDLLDPVGSSVNIVLESSHGSFDDSHADLRRGDIDLPVLKSCFCDFEDLLMNDGCTGVAVLAKNRPIEVQLDEHKLIFVYARDLKPFRRVLRRWGVPRINDIRLIAEGEHLHHSCTAHPEEFQHLAGRIGCADFDSVLSDENDRYGW